jgi:hypothetical protein
MRTSWREGLKGLQEMWSQLEAVRSDDLQGWLVVGVLLAVNEFFQRVVHEP